jgi:hypothetical protein
MSAILTAFTSRAAWPGIGLLGLAMYYLCTTGQYELALTAFLNALAVFGLRHVDAKTDAAVSLIQAQEVKK